MKSATTNISTILKSMSKSEIIEVLTVIAGQYPGVRKFIEKKETEGAGIDDLLAEKYLEKIAVLSEEEVWYDRYTETGHLPDHWDLYSEFKALNKKGHPDVFVAIGPEYLKTANILIEKVSGDDNCDFGMNECLLEIVKGIENSSLPVTTQIVTLIQMDIADVWGMIGEPTFTKHQYPKEVWSQVADMLSALKADYYGPPESTEWSYYREEFARWVIRCLDRAGRKKEMFSYAETEARENYMYGDYVDILICEGDLEAAKRWIELGITATQRIYPGIASNLSKKNPENLTG